MRKFGYSVIDTIIEHSMLVKDKPVVNPADRQRMEALLRETLPQQGTPWQQVFEQTLWDVFTHMMYTDHPRFFGWVPGPSNFVSVMGDLLASGFNIFTGVWAVSPGPTQIEIIVLDWLKELVGCPKLAGGVLVSGGSIANLSGLAVARRIKLQENTDKAVIYFSTQTHWSNERAARVLGFSSGQIRKIAVDADYRMDIDSLERQISMDRQAGLRPFCIIANAGTTNTGAIDPLAILSRICEKEDLWLHVDGAYGVAACLSEEGKQLLDGIEHAHSITVDPHKWFFQPYEVGCLLVRDQNWLGETFNITGDYMRNLEEEFESINFYSKGIQLTRGNKALKLWMSLKIFGVDSFRAAVNSGIHMAKYAQSLWQNMEGWQVTSPATLGVVTFRYAPEGADENYLELFNDRVANAVAEDKFAMVSTTRLNGKLVMRMCTINPRTTELDIAETVSRINRLAREMHNTDRNRQAILGLPGSAAGTTEYGKNKSGVHH